MLVIRQFDTSKRFVHYPRKKIGDAGGWRAKYVRCHVAKVRYFDISKVSNRHPTMTGGKKRLHRRYTHPDDLEAAWHRGRYCRCPCFFVFFCGVFCGGGGGRGCFRGRRGGVVWVVVMEVVLCSCWR